MTTQSEPDDPIIAAMRQDIAIYHKKIWDKMFEKIAFHMKNAQEIGNSGATAFPDGQLSGPAPTPAGLAN